jgi:uncharacterized membrane protein YhaH (DUF805 family)
LVLLLWFLITFIFIASVQLIFRGAPASPEAVQVGIIGVPGFGIGWVTWWAAAFLLAGWMSFALAAKRLHDRDKSACWILLFYVAPWALAAVAYYAQFAAHAWFFAAVIPAVIAVGIGIWGVVELSYLHGTVGPNRYGSDPSGSAS